jgi:3-hydroxyisobutyrate dehydrogenase-like beta-hydroxyacid dehydrogenase
MQQVGFIGLGSMGLPMARNLLESGFALKVYNRTANKATSLIQAGAQAARCPADVLPSEGLVVTMVSNDQALEEMVFGSGGIGPHLTSKHVHISMSTISPEISKKLAHFHQEKGAGFVAATVSGRPEAAASKKLFIYMAGELHAKQKAQPALQAMGQKVFDLGEDPSQSNTMKLCVNFLLLSAIEALSEVCAFAKKSGLEPNMVTQIFGETLFSCPAYQIYGKIIAGENFQPGFHLALGMKDINLLRMAAEACRVPLPLANLLHERLLTAMAKGREHLDWSAIALSSFEDAGLLEKEIACQK